MHTTYRGGLMNRVDNNYVLQKTKINKPQTNNQLAINNRNTTQSFEDVLSKVNAQHTNTEVKFSKHALARLDQRKIVLSVNDVKQINLAINKASAKGIKDALILMDNKAFVANVKNKTIITASTNEQLKENVFTKIDGAVII